MNSKEGFTLLELLLVVVLVAVITAFSVPVFNSLVTTNELNDASDKIVHALRRAQLLSEHLAEDETWGVFVESGQVTVFAGSDYLSRNVTFDEIYDFSDQISISGEDEFVFSKVFGEPSIIGTISVTNSFGNQDISVNEEGVINF